MKRFHLSLRFKLTAIVAGVMSVCCLLLTAVSLSTSAHMMEALPLTEPALVGADGSVTESDVVACEPAVIASAAHSTFRVQNLAAMVLVILAGSAAAYLLARLGENLERLNTLVEQLLQLCSNRAPAFCRRIDLGRIAREAAGELGGFGAEMQVEGEAFADGSPELYRQLVLNLLGNAVKYGGGQVRVRLENSDGFAVLRVEDNGPGIPPEAAERVFEPFFRADRSRSREVGGNGLGLAIVQRIARQYGGTAQAGPSALGGACFTVRLPFDGR